MQKTTTTGSAHVLRHRESHAESLYAVAFNQVDASLASTFATVGANRVTVYSIQPGSRPARKQVEVAAMLVRLASEAARR